MATKMDQDQACTHKGIARPDGFARRQWLTYERRHPVSDTATI